MSNWQDYYEDEDFDDKSFENFEELPEEEDNIICPFCGEIAWNIDGSFVCDLCGDVEED